VRRGAWFSSALLALHVSLSASNALAQNAPQTNDVSPPRLVQSVPVEAEAPTAEGYAPRAVLELVIDEQGQVAEARIIDSVGAELDARVLEAAKSFKFEPARVGEKPVRVKIRYAFELTLKAPPPEAAEPVAPATATPPIAPETPASPPAAVSEKPAPRAAADTLESFEATAEVEAPPSEVVKRSIDETALRKMPGTRGDALRAIEVLPGIARTTLGQGNPIIRGANFNESETNLNGTPVPFMYHFGGLTSFMNTRLVSKLDVYPGNFGVKYGRVVGGVIDVHTRDPRTDRLHLVLDLNLIDSSALVEIPLGENTSVALAARRSNIDFVFENFVPKDAYNVLAAPVYYDYQGILTHRFRSGAKLRFLGYGGSDSLKLFFSDPVDEDPGLAGNISATIQYHRFATELESAPNRALTGRLSATLGYASIEQRIGALEQSFKGPEVFARAESSLELSEQARVTVGGDFRSSFYQGSYRGPFASGFDGDPNGNDPLVAQRQISLDGDMSIVRPAGYIELNYRPIPNLFIIPGVRVDYFNTAKAVTVDPRLALRYEITPETALKAGVGRFTQGLEFWQNMPRISNPKLDPYYAYQASAGFEQRFGNTVKFGAEGFYKRLEDLVVATPDRRSPGYENTGVGRIYGLETSFQARSAENALFYFAYTLSRSERKDRPGQDYRLFDRDQTHILSLVGSYPLGKGWEVGARFRLVSGNPTTPVVGSTYDARSGVYLPAYGAVNSERNPVFHQLDLRVEKVWKLSPVTLAAYLDVLNVYNAQPREGYRYSYDYTKREAVGGMPLFPSLGLRGEL